jgi:predicted permease
MEISNLWTDVRYAWRGLVGRPGYTAVIVLTLALGLGATAAIFSAVNALLLRPFPFRDPDQLIRITAVRGGEDGFLSVPEQDDIRALSIVDDVALYTDQGMYNASGFGTPEELPATITTHNLFKVLGVAPAIGTTFPADADRSRRFELVISYDLWTRRFGRDPNIVGRTMTLDGAPGYYIHGVLPAGVNFPAHSDLFRSSGIGADPAQYRRRDLRSRMGLARLKSGVTAQQAQAALDQLAERLSREFPATNAGLSFRATPLRDLYVGNVRPYLLLLFAAVTLVLAVSAANVVNLLLSRAIARDRETSVRTALGASRWSLVRQQLVESVMLALLGGAGGLVLAWVGIRSIAGMVRVPLPQWMSITLDATTAVFMIVVALGTGLLAGLIAATRQSDRDLAGALKEGARGSAGGRRHHRVRQMLVIAEVALAMMLIVGASLMVQSFLRLQRADPGFQPDGLLSFRVEMGWKAYDSHAKVMSLIDRTLDRLRELPGVTAIGIDSNLPLSGKPREPYEVAIDGQSGADRQTNPFVHLHVINPEYFTAFRAPLVRGRAFDETDVTTSQPVAIVSQTAADRLFGSRDPIGQRIAVGNADRPENWATIVGLTAPIKLQHLASSGQLDVYRPYRQVWLGGFYFAVRTSGVHPSSLANVAPPIVTALDPDQSFFDVQVMTDRIASGIWQQQISGALFAAFGGLAFVLAVIGLYGVLSYLVTQQQREIGVRMALGADAGRVRRMVVGRGVRLTLAGIVAGVAGAWFAARASASLLFDVSASDPWTFIGAPVVLLLTAAVACWLPAYRASRIDPLISLKSE